MTEGKREVDLFDTSSFPGEAAAVAPQAVLPAGEGLAQVQALLLAAWDVNQAVYAWAKHNVAQAVQDRSIQAVALEAHNGKLFRQIRCLEKVLGTTAKALKATTRVAEAVAVYAAAWTVYVLELEHGCVYVGTTEDLSLRMQQHRAGAGAEWTSLHAPIRVWAQYQFTEKQQALQCENYLAQQLASKYGAQHVRGGLTAGARRAPLDAEALEVAYASVLDQMRVPR